MVNHNRMESTSPENDVRKETQKAVPFVVPSAAEEEEELKTSSEHDSTATIETENSSTCILSGTTTTTTKSQSQSQQLLRFSNATPEIICYLPLPHEFEPSQRDALWWSCHDYQVFAETAKSISKEVRKHRTLTGGIDEAYRRAGVVANEIDNEDGVFDAMQRLSLDSGLAHWCTHGHSRRGLERSGSRMQSALRGGDAKTAQQCLMELQNVRSLAGDWTNDERLRSHCVAHSKTARLFARMMGQADAAAATRSHTFMRRWSDLGSTNNHNRIMANSSASPNHQGGRECSMRYQRTSSLPQSTLYSDNNNL